MEIGVLVLLTLMGIGGLFVEKTKVGGKHVEYTSKKFFGIDLNEMED